MEANDERKMHTIETVDLAAEWSEYKEVRDWGGSAVEFIEWLGVVLNDSQVVRDSITVCGDCDEPEWRDDTYYIDDISRTVCESCSDEYRTCDRCENRVCETTYINDDYQVCESCRGNYYSWCDGCESYYPDSGGCENCDGGCSCEAPAQQFTVRNDGAPPLANDVEVQVTLPAGVISDEGIGEIATAIRAWSQAMPYSTAEEVQVRDQMSMLSYRLGELDARWQTKDGNFTKRLSRFAYKNLTLKVPPALLSQVGNIASDHSRPVDFTIAVTRNLNMSPEEFCNEDSCWWRSYSGSRCRLKSNGGFGLRAFDTESRWHQANGRAWVMPLRLTEGVSRRPGDCDDPTCCKPRPATVRLVPTFETMTPDAFVVFNTYGTLDGYTAARIVSHMAGWTYRKIEFSAGSSDDFYVNSKVGYLIAPEEIADDYTDGELRLESLVLHSPLFAEETAKKNESKELAHA